MRSLPVLLMTTAGCISSTSLSPPSAAVGLRPPASTRGVALTGTLTGYSYGTYPAADARTSGSTVVDQFIIYVRPAVRQKETEIDGLHARWRVAGRTVPLTRALDALRRIDDARHLVWATVHGVLRGKQLIARDIVLKQSRRRRPVEPIYNSAPGTAASP